MNSRILTLIFVAILVASGVFAQNKSANNIDDSHVALQGYSPVSYLDLGVAQKGLKAYKSEHNNIFYYFTNEDQKRSFEANPSHYLPQYGGYCAFGVSVGAKFRVDPNKFVVMDEKYYLFLYDLEVDAQQLWLAGEHDELVKAADRNWTKLSE